MFKYNCKLCSFNSNIEKSYNRHIKTKKHIQRNEKQKKEEELIENIKNKTCKYCGKILHSVKSKERHYGKCRKNRENINFYLGIQMEE